MNRFFVMFAALCAAFAPTLVSAEGWPQYRGPRGDGVSPETINNTDWQANPPKQLWKVPTPLGFSSFAVADGRAFTLVAIDGDEGEKVEACVALDAETGRELWSVQLGASEYGHDGGNAGAPNNRGGDGPRSTPTVDDGLVYVYDSHLVLSCFKAASGELVWKHDIINDFDGRQIKWLNATSPLLVGDTIYVGGGGAGQSFLAFDKTSGKLLWKTGDETITHATPTYAEINGKPQVIFFVQSGLVSLNADDGKELWRTKFPFNVSTAASPVVEGNRVFCSAGYGVGSLLVEVNDGPEPKEIWFKANELMNHWSTPVAHDGHLYGMFEFKKYGDAPLQCVDLATGEIKWSQRGFGPGNCILAGDKLLALADNGELVLVSASPEKYEELSRLKAVDGKCWSTPALSDGRVYVRSTEEGVSLSLE